MGEASLCLEMETQSLIFAHIPQLRVREARKCSLACLSSRTIGWFEKQITVLPTLLTCFFLPLIGSHCHQCDGSKVKT